MSNLTRRVRLSVETVNNEKQIAAAEVDASGQPIPDSDGTIEDRPLSQLEWLRDGGQQTLRVWFHFKGKKKGLADWPFADPDMPIQPEQRYIEIGPGQTRLTTLKNNFTNGNLWWTYKVCAPDTDIEPLDPMIIIRQRSSFALAPVVVAAIGGALVGALLTYALLVNRVFS